MNTTTDKTGYIPLYQRPEKARTIAKNILSARNEGAIVSLLVAASALVDTINATGGLGRDENDNIVPVADHEWMDLADAAQAAEEGLHGAQVVEELEVNHDNVL